VLILTHKIHDLSSNQHRQTMPSRLEPLFIENPLSDLSDRVTAQRRDMLEAEGADFNARALEDAAKALGKAESKA
jgi:hypothetical protein